MHALSTVQQGKFGFPQGNSLPDVTVALQVWPRIVCVDNANRTEARKYNLNFFITMLFQRAKTKAMVRKDFMAKWFSEK